jgi:S1-C subfamily serine protease
VRAGDRITKVAGQAVKTADDVAERIATRKPGDVVEVVVQRDGDSETMKVTLGTQPRSATQG